MIFLIGVFNADQLTFCYFVIKLSTLLDLSKLVGQIYTAHKASMVCGCIASSIIPIAGIPLPGMVYRYLCTGNLPFEFVHSVSDAKN